MRNTWSTCFHASNSQQPQETEMFVHQTDELLGLQLSETPSRREIKITSFINNSNSVLAPHFWFEAQTHPDRSSRPSPNVQPTQSTISMNISDLLSFQLQCH